MNFTGTRDHRVGASANAIESVVHPLELKHLRFGTQRNFAYGFGNSLLFPLSAGGTAVLEPRRPSAQVVVERMLQDAPTLFFAGPTFFAALLAADLPADTFRSVRLCASAGEALPAALYRRFTERFGVEVLDGIGSTEALHIFLSNREGAVRPGTSGTAVQGYDLAVRDEPGQPVPDAASQPNCMHAPSGQPAKSSAKQKPPAGHIVSSTHASPMAASGE